MRNLSTIATATMHGKKGAAVAAAVAFLEQQQEGGRRQGSSDKSASQPDEKCGKMFARQAGRSEDADSGSFEGAILDFDLTAEDVRKFVAESMQKIEDAAQDQDCMMASMTSEYIASDDYEDTTEESSSSSSGGDGHALTTIAEEEVTMDAFDEASSDSGASSQEEAVMKQRKGKSLKKEMHASRDANSPSSDSSSSRKDSSTCCNGDFQWIPPKPRLQLMDAKPPIHRHHPPPAGHRDRTPRRMLGGEKSAPGSLDRRRSGSPRTERHQRDLKSRSSCANSPPRLEDFVHPLNFHAPMSPSPCANWGCNSPNATSSQDRHNPLLMCGSIDPQQRPRGSNPNLFMPNNVDYQCGCGGCGFRHMPYAMPFYFDPRGYHWGAPMLPNKLADHDEKMRKMQQERDNLHLQVQVLGEQIEAQNEKISDLEKSLGEKKQMLSSAEDSLQREMLSRSSLETQKLELMSTISDLKLQQAALERENLELKTAQQQQIANCAFEAKKAAFLARMSAQPALTSTPVHTSSQMLRKSPSPSPVAVGSVTSPRRVDGSDHQSPQTPPANYRRQIELHYSSLPRQQFLSNGSSSFSVMDANANPSSSSAASVAALNGGVKKGVAFGMGLSSLLGVKARGQSVPNLADTETIVIGDSNNSSLPQSPSLQLSNKRGIRKILGKIKRSNSGTLDEFSNCGEFQRGGVRATASARLGWTESSTAIKPDKPFADWDVENICDWLQDLGLDQYVLEAKRWVKNGQQLQEANMNEIEKELNIKNPLHKKKLQLALNDIDGNSSSDPFLSKAGNLDTAWVLRWLDDIGLPQHKEAFLLNRIDGRVLHRLTMDDLALLHVSTLLHVSSIKRGIQVLRENNYESGCLQRRTLAEDPAKPSPDQISRWTTHRVMEWLKSVDLAEYAPNLRGAGVHGGLMVLENKFNAELLATLLSIAPNKTLLRRHLSTHFKELLGKKTIQAKREAEGTLGYIPLIPSAKLKISKKSHFSLKRSKSKCEADYGDLVCPLKDHSGEECHNGSPNIGMMKKNAREEGASPRVDVESISSSSSSPIPDRHDSK